MTVIAANRKEMAGDSRVTCGSTYYNASKVFRIGDSIVGVCGDAGHTTKFLAWFRRECPADEVGMTLDDDHAFGALVLNARGLFYYSDCVEPDAIMGRYHAIGAGSDIAMTALSYGKSPSDAVRRACKLNPMACGLPLKCLSVKPRKKIKTPLPPKGAQKDTPVSDDGKPQEK